MSAPASTANNIKKILALAVLLPVLVGIAVLLYALLSFFATIVLFLLTISLVAALGLVLWALIEERFLGGAGDNMRVHRGEDGTVVVEIDHTPR